MDWWQIALAFGILAAVAYRAALVFFRAHAARIQMTEEHRYENLSTDYGKTMLVLGDSTGAGVGAARPEDSIAGRLAEHIGATYVENRAASGAVVADLRGQIEKATLNAYDLILIQIGAGDIVFFHDAEKVAKELDLSMMTLPDAKTTLLMSSGNVGGAQLFPVSIRPFHTLATHAYRRWFAKVAKRRKATYVDLYLERKEDIFLDQPEVYFSEDGLHPSSEGYALWFSKVKAAIDTPTHIL